MSRNEITARALVIGNATVDEIYAVASLPKPGESVLGQFRLRDVGGKGANVATLLARCGLPTQLTAVVGDDERGSFVRHEFSGESSTPNLNLDIAVSPTTSTDVSLVYSDSNGGSAIVTTVDAAHSLEWSSAEQALSMLHKHDMLFLQANLTETLTRRIVERAKALELTIIFNPSPCTPWVQQIIKDVDVIFVNAEESCALTGSSDEAAVIALLEQGPRRVVLTRGEHGALLGINGSEVSNAGYEVISIAAVAIDVTDTTGAGDTYLAVAMASASLRGVLLDTTALHHGASAAGITIRSYGTRSAFPTADELAAILVSDHQSHPVESTMTIR